MADEKPRRKKAAAPAVETPAASEPRAVISVGEVPTEPVVELVVLGDRAVVALAVSVDLTEIERGRLLGDEDRLTRSLWASLERRVHGAVTEAIVAALGHRIDGCA